jgi:hypothetical protein
MAFGGHFGEEGASGDAFMMLGGMERSLQLIGIVISEVAAVHVHELSRADQTGKDQTEYLLLSLGLRLGLDHQLLL